MKTIRAVFDQGQFDNRGYVRISASSDNALMLDSDGVIKLKDVEKTASPNKPGDGVYGEIDEGIQTLRLNTSVSRKQTGTIPSVEGVNVTLFINEFMNTSPPAPEPDTNGGGST